MDPRREKGRRLRRRTERSVVDLLGDAPIAGPVRATFRAMEIAEEEIAAARTRYPRRVHRRIDAAFGLLWPTPLLRGKHDELYRHHVRELLARVVRDEDTAPGTRAEVLAAIMAAATASPLDHAGQYLAEQLFAELYPDAEVGARTVREEYRGAYQETLTAARRACAQRDRRVP